jgi:hypothetical protein
MARAASGPYGTPGVVGSIGGVTLTQGRRGQTILKAKPIPSNPQSDAQMGNRAMFGFVSKQWREVAAEDQLSYHDRALAQQISDFAAYSQANANRWQANRYPSQNIDAAGAHAATATGTVDVTKGVGVPDTIVISLNGGANDWGIAVFRKNGGAPTGTRAELWDVLPVEAGQHDYTIETMGEVGDQWGVIVFSDDGDTAPIVVDARPA